MGTGYQMFALSSPVCHDSLETYCFAQKAGLIREPASNGEKMPTKTIVNVEVHGGGRLGAEVQVNKDNLDPDQMPLHLTGVFTKLPSDSEIGTELAELWLRSARNEGGSSHLIRFFGRDAYRFVMNDSTSLEFTAEHQSINPTTGKPGFTR